MKRFVNAALGLRTLGLAALSVSLTAACGGGASPNTPTTLPTPPPNGITLGPDMPASGAVLPLGSCGFGACTKALAFLFLVTFDANLDTPVFRVRLTRDDGKECLSSYQTDLVPLVAGKAHSYDGDTLLLSTTPPASPGAGDPNCAPPFVTTRIAVELRDSHVTAPVLLAQEFDVTYHWVP
jgi:hypothetical protein